MEKQSTILIVDDEPAGRETLAGLLFSPDYRLVLAENGQDAFAKAIECIPDLILLDVMMPQMDGFEVCRLMRSDPLLAEVPIVIVTALDDRESKLRGIESGADDFIPKPFDRIELRARIRTITRLNRYRRLLTERARFAWVVDQAKEGYIILDDNSTILYANNSASQYLGIPSDDYEGLSFLETVTKKYRLEPEENWRGWPHANNLDYFLILPETRQSNSMWLKLEILELGGNSKMLVRITNETDTIVYHQEIRNFHKFISHKLRTPMSQIVMVSNLIQFDQNRGQVSAEDSEVLLDALQEGANRLKSEIEDIVSYLNTSNNYFSEREFVSVADLQPMILRTSEEFEVGSFHVNLLSELDAKYNVPLSKNSIEVIVREILENSVKFHPQKAPKIEVSFEIVDDQLLRMRFADDGIHLSPDQLSQVWAPYYQVEKNFTGEVAGMGLGLSSVAQLVWNAGGKWQMRNREDRQGVVVVLEIPIRSESEKTLSRIV